MINKSKEFDSILFISTYWGTRYGGVNAFNKDLCVASQKLAGKHVNVYCLVLKADETEVQIARNDSVELISADIRGDNFEIEHLERVIDILNKKNIKDVDWIIGHDLITGDFSAHLAKSFNAKLALIHHMDISSYKIFQRPDSLNVHDQVAEQKRVLKLSDVVFSVGPFLKQSAIDLTEREVRMLVPGMSDISPKIEPNYGLRVITFGRFSKETAKTKGHELALKSFARAIKLESEISDLPPSIKLTLIGVLSSQDKTEEYLKIAESESGRVLPIFTLPYIEDRSKLLEELTNSDLCLMLSLHEGFGLVGWEAISAEVPIIISKQSGLYKFLFDLGGFAIGSIMDVDITGIEEKDIDKVSKIIYKFIRNPNRAKKNIRNLKKWLISKGFTWESTARTLMKGLDIEYSEDVQRIPFKFLKSFDESDHEIFFGRDNERKEFLDKLERFEFNLLLGKSGVGKTSFLKASILTELKNRNIQPYYIRCSHNLVEDVINAIAVEDIFNLFEYEILDYRNLSNSIIDYLERITSKYIVLIFDQFEEVFISFNQTQKNNFFRFISDLVTKSSGKIRVIFSFREDFMVELNEFISITPSIFHNVFRLKPFTKDNALDVISKSLETLNLTIEKNLFIEIINSLSETSESLIEPAQLQIVLTTLFNNLQSDETEINLTHYNRLGGVKGILTDYVDSALESFNELEKNIVKEILKSMVSSKNTRIPIKVSQIEEIPLVKLNKSQVSISLVLSQLVNKRLISRKKPEGIYELTHEYLIDKIKVWLDVEHYKSKEIQDLLRQEENNWKIGKMVISETILEMINKYKDSIIIDDYNKGVILRGSIEYDYELASWINANMNNMDSSEFINDALHSSSNNIKLRAMIAGLQILEIDTIVPMVIDELKNIGNPSFLKKLNKINLDSNRLNKNQLNDIKNSIEYRIKKNMVYVEGGEFIMGRDKQEVQEIVSKGVPDEWFIHEIPRRKKYVEGFWIDKFLVTNEDYKEFNPKHLFNVGDEKKPVTDISWFEAKRYAEWLGKELPTEEEWEKSARGIDGRLFPWGNEWDPDKCNTKLSGISGKSNVDAYPNGTSPYGCFDMAGNVWEWTSSVINQSDSVIVRGGSWSKYNVLPWCSYKFDYNAKDGQQNVGFRCIIRVRENIK